MKIAVLDTSALIRLYVPDGPIPDGMEKFIDDACKVESILLVPELALAEVAQVLWKKECKEYLQPSETDEIMCAIMELPLEIISHYNFLADALAISRKYGLTVYDSLFVACAKRKNAILFTADKKLQKVFDVIKD